MINPSYIRHQHSSHFIDQNAERKHSVFGNSYTKQVQANVVDSISSNFLLKVGFDCHNVDTLQYHHIDQIRSVQRQNRLGQSPHRELSHLAFELSFDFSDSSTFTSWYDADIKLPHISSVMRFCCHSHLSQHDIGKGEMYITHQEES
jgi:hypothetical protein